MRTREQDRMDMAWDCLCGHFGPDPRAWATDPVVRKQAIDYYRAVKRTSARIYTCGLGQALAFLKSRGSAHAQQAEQDLARLTLHMLGQVGQSNQNDLIAYIRTQDADGLFLATDETLRIVAWLGRYLSGADIPLDDQGTSEAPEEPEATGTEDRDKAGT
jgi:hypothetical protein